MRRAAAESAVEEARMRRSTAKQKLMAALGRCWLGRINRRGSEREAIDLTGRAKIETDQI